MDFAERGQWVNVLHDLTAIALMAALPLLCLAVLNEASAEKSRACGGSVVKLALRALTGWYARVELTRSSLIIVKNQAMKEVICEKMGALW
jgi:hypothetical protein